MCIGLGGLYNSSLCFRLLINVCFSVTPAPCRPLITCSRCFIYKTSPRTWLFSFPSPARFGNKNRMDLNFCTSLTCVFECVPYHQDDDKPQLCHWLSPFLRVQTIKFDKGLSQSLSLFTSPRYSSRYVSGLQPVCIMLHCVCNLSKIWCLL